MSRSAMLLFTTLAFSVMCCCGGIFSAEGLQDLIRQNVGNVVEENIPEAEEIQSEIETRVAEMESGQSDVIEGTPAAEESQAAVAEGEQGAETGDLPAVGKAPPTPAIPQNPGRPDWRPGIDPACRRRSGR